MTSTTHPGPRPRAPGPEDVWQEAAAAFDRWLAEDPEGLPDLVGVMTPVLWHIARAYALPAETAEEVLAATWTALVRRRAEVLDPAGVGGWLAVAGRREACRRARALGYEPSPGDADLTIRVPRPRPAGDSSTRGSREQRLCAALDSLPERCRRLLRVAAFVDRPDYAALAADLGIPLNSLAATRGRCLAKLRIALIEAGVLR